MPMSFPVVILNRPERNYIPLFITVSSSFCFFDLPIDAANALVLFGEVPGELEIDQVVVTVKQVKKEAPN